MTDKKNSEDLSSGEISKNDEAFGESLLKEQRQKASFREWSFRLAWVFAALFFGSVLLNAHKVICSLTKESVEFIQLSKVLEKKSGITNNNGENKAFTAGAIDDKEPATKPSENISAQPPQLKVSNILNQLLILLGLLSAVGTTLAVAVIRFSFSNDKDSKKDEITIFTSPLSNSLAEFIKQIATLLKTEK